MEEMKRKQASTLFGRDQSLKMFNVQLAVSILVGSQENSSNLIINVKADCHFSIQAKRKRFKPSAQWWWEPFFEEGNEFSEYFGSKR